MLSSVVMNTAVSLVYKIAFLADMKLGCTAGILINVSSTGTSLGYIRNSCRSFANMDINARFSVIFHLTVFGEINEHGRLFVSRYHFRSKCSFCQIELRAVNEFHGSQRC